MFFIILFVAMILASIATTCLWEDSLYGDAFAAILLVIGIIGLSCCGLTIIVIKATNESYAIEYQQEKMIVEAKIKDPTLPDSERAFLLETMLERNKDIALTRYWKENIFVEWFLHENAADFEPYVLENVTP